MRNCDNRPMSRSQSFKAILVISDQHFPFHHRDLFSFLKALKKKYKFDCIVNIGDELDYHAISFHDSDPELFSPAQELKEAKVCIAELAKLFPRMFILESNHGSLVYRKQKFHGLPRDVFKNYADVLEAPKGWSWHFDLTLKMSNGQEVYFHHGKAKPIMKLSQSMGINAVQGHFHENFSINYWSSPKGLFWQMQVGCLIDKKSMAFAYNKNNLNRPIIGVGVIINGQPKLEPMVLNKDGRWTGKLA